MKGIYTLVAFSIQSSTRWYPLIPTDSLNTLVNTAIRDRAATLTLSLYSQPKVGPCQVHCRDWQSTLSGASAQQLAAAGIA